MIQGKGYAGLSFPGCPTTHQQQFQLFDQTQSFQGQKFIDEHQKIHQLRQGDVTVLPAGVAHWFYNSGDTPVIIIYVYDVNNNANQLEPRHKWPAEVFQANPRRGFGYSLFVYFYGF
ncbi:hypothetical protein GUJ93_ZPchr0013g35112 [Zizania palustris]|uniref:Cupin type-1 domain-containing protein n=1 Tax=Zizania palustris TaxID=103762 RepID=A0A8J6BUT5_ZIZPA|nr:hypothetical protein GUJ93_ZPchr0013g35112 [Zizania palustris]